MRYKNHKQKQSPKDAPFEVRIEKIVPGGYGFGYADGKPIFVQLAAAGDKVLARARERKGKAIFAEIVEIVESSAQRTEPPCPYFGVCGGCDFQQMNYGAQLAAKEMIVRDCLTRIGKINYDQEIEIFGSPRELGYRARAQWHVDARNKRIGYFKRHSHNIVDVEICPILVPELQTKLADLRGSLDYGEFWAEKAEIETAASGGRVSVYSAELIEATHEIYFDAHGERYFYDAQSFFQGNPSLIEKMIERATAGAAGGRALDLFCGVGLFSLPLARKFGKVFAVEASARAIDFARRNAENARLQNIEFAVSSVGEFLDETSETIDFILLDPPRAGADAKTVENILKIKPARVSYVSCDPATLARDLRLLTESVYFIESAAIFDLFPQTHHVETVVRLKRR